ncbi:MAG: DUF2244 domain-containing protein [Stappiaceae bacterium]
MNRSEQKSLQTDIEDPPFFSAVLTPYRSLGVKGFRTLMLVLAAICTIAGTVFLLMGAWPVFGFFGLDVVLVWLAFKMNYRSARAYELVNVSAHEVYVRGVTPAGKVSEFRFNPRWARLTVERVESEGVQRLTLMHGGNGCAIGNFLNPDDRESFADALSEALARAKAGGPFPQAV